MTIDQTTDQTIDQTTDQTIDLTTDKTIDQTTDQTIDLTIDQAIDLTTRQTYDNTDNESDLSYDSWLEDENVNAIREIAKAEASLAEAIALLPDRIETICAKYNDMLETDSETLRMEKRVELDEAIKRLKDWHMTEMCKLKQIRSNHIQYLLFDGDTNLKSEYFDIINGLKDL